MLKRWLILTLAILAASYLVPGVDVRSFGAAVGAAAVLGLLNVFVRPLVLFLTLPLSCVTLGLFLFVVNGLMFFLMGRLVPQWIEVPSIHQAIFASVVVSVIGALLGGGGEEE